MSQEAQAEAHEITLRSNKALELRVSELLTQSEAMAREKGLLQDQHDALTLESRTLQLDLAQAQSKVQKLDHKLEDERRKSAEGMQMLQVRAKGDEESLSKCIADLRADLNSERVRFEEDRRSWGVDRAKSDKDRDALIEQIKALEISIKTPRIESTDPTREANDLDAENDGASKVQKIVDLMCCEETIRQQNTLQALKRELEEARRNLHDAECGRAAVEQRFQALEDEMDVLQTLLEENRSSANDEVFRLKEETNAQQVQMLSIREEMLEIDTSRTEAEKEVKILQGRLRDTSSWPKAPAHHLDQNEQPFQLDKQRTLADETTSIDNETALHRKLLNTQLWLTQSQTELQKASLEAQNREKVLMDQLAVKEKEVSRLEIELIQPISHTELATTKCKTPLNMDHGQSQRPDQKFLSSIRGNIDPSQKSSASQDQIAIERKDLHKEIKSAKLEVETLQYQLDDFKEREHLLRSQVRGLRSECSSFQQKIMAFAKEKGRLEAQCEKYRKREAAGIENLSKQFNHLKTRYRREQNFRSALVYEKRFLMMEIDMYRSW